MAALLGAYVGGGDSNLIPQFANLLGRTPDLNADFIDDSSTYAEMVQSATNFKSDWQGKVANMSVEVPMGVTTPEISGDQLANIANGVFDNQFNSAFSSVAQAFPNAYIRLGSEFNYLNGYPWNTASKEPSTFIAAFQHLVILGRAVSSNFKFVWNPGIYPKNIPPDQCYPGQSYVDVHAVDIYDIDQNVRSNPDARWSGIYSTSDNDWALAKNISYAQSMGKPYAFPEWAAGSTDGKVGVGTNGGGDDPEFMAKMAPLVAASEYSCYWDSNQAGWYGQLSNGQWPGSAAMFIASFGVGSAGSQSSVKEIQNISAIIMPHQASYTPVTAPTLKLTNCYAGIVQNAPKHFIAVVWNTAAQTSASVAFGQTVSAANLYDPSQGSTVVQGVANASSVSFALAANKPLIIAIAL